MKSAHGEAERKLKSHIIEITWMGGGGWSVRDILWDVFWLDSEDFLSSRSPGGEMRYLQGWMNSIGMCSKYNLKDGMELRVGRGIEQKKEKRAAKKVKDSLFEPPLLSTLPEGREGGRLQDIWKHIYILTNWERYLDICEHDCKIYMSKLDVTRTLDDCSDICCCWKFSVGGAFCRRD